ncbi:PqqD family protein [Polynucleobacter sphagniphilus]|jgi:hypothetical protein|uniref:PqqD family protein n=1 Tax=Polynucleobacter sphagniphilus TaxID=1743169 RepID=A0AA43MBV0_9BURK|nr:hypothetical protein [Polynucleobacter sphagniphilus]MDH6513686.1 hypothetical protein [Polynucleobacter sphagniphilus]
MLICNPKIVSEEFDNEIILIDIEKGLYFTIGGLGVDLWRLYSMPCSLEYITQLLSEHHINIDPEVLSSFIDQLQKNNLLVSAAENLDVPTSRSQHLFSSILTPSLSIYSDLAELIAIDPVHEVDKSLGWPVRQENFPKLT